MRGPGKEARILLVMAHPDDEVIFGWPILQNWRENLTLLCCSSDANNSERKWCAHRKNALKRVMDQLQMSHICLDYNSDFYKLPPRNGELANFRSRVSEIITSEGADYVFTHNPLGEYCHLDHQLVHEIVINTAPKVLFTDIFINNNWSPYTTPSPLVRDLFFSKKIGSFRNDLERYVTWESFYKEGNVWTWNQPPIPEADVFLIQTGN